MTFHSRATFLRMLLDMQSFLAEFRETDLQSRAEIGRASRELFVLARRHGLLNEAEQLRRAALHTGCRWAEREAVAR